MKFAGKNVVPEQCFEPMLCGTLSVGGIHASFVIGNLVLVCPDDA